MIEYGPYLTAFSIGLLGSVHCVGMCGGISSAISFGVPDVENNTKKLFLYHLIFNLGRISTYALLGVIAGLFEVVLVRLFGQSSSFYLRALTGLILIFIGLHLFGIKSGVNFLEEIGSKVWKLLLPLTKYFIPTKNLAQAYVVGGLWGGLPCGLVYSTLAYAIPQGNWVTSLVIMLIFGLGTMPSMLFMGTLSKKISHWVQAYSLKKIEGVTMVVFGIWTLIAAYKVKIGCCH